jgi:ribosomal-protein-alanine N-acetyltransferase
VAREVAPGESELLNLAVAPEWRSQGVGRDLVTALLRDHPVTLYLEVREGNTVARKFYKSMGFQEVSVRKSYYESPAEAAIVMKFHSC